MVGLGILCGHGPESAGPCSMANSMDCDSLHGRFEPEFVSISSPAFGSPAVNDSCHAKCNRYYGRSEVVYTVSSKKAARIYTHVEMHFQDSRRSEVYGLDHRRMNVSCNMG